MIGIRRRTYGLAVALAPALVAFMPAAGQTVLSPALVQGRRGCDGDTVTSVEIRSRAPSYSGVVGDARQAATSVLGLPYVPTRPSVIASYLRVAAGRVCTELDRSESERLLRAQPFIASAAVYVITDSPGRVFLVVDVVDEPRPVFALGFRRGTVSAVTAGTANLSGRGLAVVASARRGFAYRDGVGLAVVKYGVFGRPDFLAAHAERRAVDGERLSIEFAEPFITELQRRALHASTSLTSGYTGLVRPVGENVSLFVRRTFYDIGWVTRVGRSGRRAVGLAGAALLGEDVRTGESLVVVSDTGLASGPPNVFAAAYPAFAATRVAAITGLRALRFTTVRGFDALRAEQDMGIGVQFDVLAGPSVLSSGHQRDVFIAGDLYAGVGDERSFLVARALAEARSDRSSRRWDGVVASGRIAWYGKPSLERTQLASVELSAVRDLVFPMQLTFRDADGGLPGFASAPFAGGRRAIARVEERWLVKPFGRIADLAVGAFATGGKLWAGDVPYGRTTPVYASAGVSLLGTYPSGGKRTYRVDLAVPLNPARGGFRPELRISSSDRTRMLWLEPQDVSRARTGAVPVSLMKW